MLKLILCHGKTLSHGSEFVLSPATNQRHAPSKSGRYYGAVSGRYPEPVMKEHPENSDSGLGTDREYCRYCHLIFDEDG